MRILGSFVAVRAGEGFGELTDGGHELVLDRVNLTGGHPDLALCGHDARADRRRQHDGWR